MENIQQKIASGQTKTFSVFTETLRIIIAANHIIDSQLFVYPSGQSLCGDYTIIYH